MGVDVGLPFFGELWGEVGGEESWEEALDMVSSGCLRCLSFPSSDRDRIFFRDWGELVPVDIFNKTSIISMRNTAISPGGRGSGCIVWDFLLVACWEAASRWQRCYKEKATFTVWKTKPCSEENTDFSSN